MRSCVISAFVLAVALAPAATFAQTHGSSRLPGSRRSPATSGTAATSESAASHTGRSGSAETDVHDAWRVVTGPGQGRSDGDVRRDVCEVESKPGALANARTECDGELVEDLQNG